MPWGFRKQKLGPERRPKHPRTIIIPRYTINPDEYTFIEIPPTVSSSTEVFITKERHWDRTPDFVKGNSLVVEPIRDEHLYENEDVCEAYASKGAPVLQPYYQSSFHKFRNGAAPGRTAGPAPADVFASFPMIDSRHQPNCPLLGFTAPPRDSAPLVQICPEICQIVAKKLRDNMAKSARSSDTCTCTRKFDNFVADFDGNFVSNGNFNAMKSDKPPASHPSDMQCGKLSTLKIKDNGGLCNPRYS